MRLFFILEVTTMIINKNLMQRNHTAMKRGKGDIKYIVIHYVGALGSARANTDYYKSTDVGASADFWVGHSGDIWQGNDYYNYYSWHCGGGLQGPGGAEFFGKCTNKNSIGIEMCVKKRSTRTMNATDRDWYFEGVTVRAAADLVGALMVELGIDLDHVIRHYDVNGKICPNPFVYNTGAYSWEDFKKMCSEAAGAVLRGAVAGNDAETDQKKENSPKDAAPITHTTAEFAGLSEETAAELLLEICRPVAEKYHLLPSVATAQCILESGYCRTELAKKANNICGMKCELSGNTWPGSTWDGESKINIKTSEQDKAGTVYYIYAGFRKYPCIEDSIADRCAYLIGAMKGSNLRYPGITECKNYTAQIQLIKAGGYATDVNYVSKITNIIQRFGLSKYDAEVVGTVKHSSGGTVLPGSGKAVADPVQYYVRKSWNDKANQLGAYSVLENAKKQVDANWRYNVYDASGKLVYSGVSALIGRAVNFSVGIASDNSHGYNNAGHGWGETGEYNCIGLVMRSYKAAGHDPGYCDIRHMPEYLKAAGFQEVTYEVNLNTGKGALDGDIFWMLDSSGQHGHTEMYIGDGKLVGARGDFDGKPGDGSGSEIAVNAYSNMGWKKVFRLPGERMPLEEPPAPEGKTYKVQIGAYKVKTNATKRMQAVKKAGFPAILKQEGEYWKVQCGAYSYRDNAEAMQKRLKNAGFSAIIKEYT